MHDQSCLVIIAPLASLQVFLLSIFMMCSITGTQNDSHTYPASLITVFRFVLPLTNKQGVAI